MTTTAVILELSEQAGRDYNQDRLLVLRDAESSDFLAVVSDGVGGTAKGEIAAECLIEAAQSIWDQRSEFTSASELLKQLFERGNVAIAAANEAGTNTAATLVALAARGNEVVSVHAGDSRIYQCRDGATIKVTQDHSLAYAKFKLGEISEDEIATHPGQSQLLNCMTGQADVHAEFTQWQVNNGDFFVLCSDGFWELFPNQEMAALVANENSHFVIANRLEQMLQQHPRHDNTTVVMLRCDEGFATPAKTTTGTGAAAAGNASPITSRQDQLDKPQPPPSGKGKALFIIIAAAIAVIALLLWPQQSKDGGVSTMPDPLTQPTEEINEPQQPESPSQQSEQPEQPADEPERAEQPQSEMPNDVEQSDESNNQPPPDSNNSEEQDQGDPSKRIEQLKRNLDETPRETIPTDGSKPDIEVLKDYFRNGGIINEQSDLDQTDDFSDENAHIVTVQLTVHDVPVYGALVRYLKTASGLQLISGQLAYLDTIPEAPQMTFEACFGAYKQQLGASTTIDLIPDTSPTLYIDAGEYGYFWEVLVYQSVEPNIAKLHLRDASCDALRIFSLQVSG